MPLGALRWGGPLETSNSPSCSQTQGKRHSIREWARPASPPSEGDSECTIPPSLLPKWPTAQRGTLPGQAPDRAGPVGRGTRAGGRGLRHSSFLPALQLGTLPSFSKQLLTPLAYQARGRGGAAAEPSPEKVTTELDLESPGQGGLAQFKGTREGFSAEVSSELR